MTTPKMFAPQHDGSMLPIPAEDAAILDLYREAETFVKPEHLPVLHRYPIMPLVFEPQFFGDPFPLYPLVEEHPEDNQYTCYPMPGTVQIGPAGRPVIVQQMPDPRYLSAA